MIRIRKVLDNKSLRNQNSIDEIKQILKDQFELITPQEVDKIDTQLVDPLFHQARSIVFVVEGMRQSVKAFAILLHYTDINICYLEWISTSLKDNGFGLGSILYETVREECKLIGAQGLYMEVLPDEKDLCPYEVSLKQNQARIKFYEKYGARVILNSNFSKKVQKENNDLLFLVVDPLDQEKFSISKNKIREIATSVLKRKYKDSCGPEYITRVVNSFNDNPVKFREFRYIKTENQEPQKTFLGNKKIPLFVNRDHQIHHIKEKGYVEAPSRVTHIFKEISKLKCFEEHKTLNLPESILLRVHTKEYVDFLRKISKSMDDKTVYYPEMFPLRNRTRLPKDLLIRSGYYCQDSFTPIHKNVYKAAISSAECAYTAANFILSGHRVSYALCRPPGHHAESGLFGGFCYLNSAAVAAEFLSDYGKVAVLDIDFHHGNGTQNIFYKRNDVLTLSIHGNPHECFPFFSGFEDEIGEGEGLGFNINIPLPTDIKIEQYEKKLKECIEKIRNFKADYLVLSLGLDLAKGDPTGTWKFTDKDFQKIGSYFKNLHVPLVIIQEGGYHQKDLGKCAKSFFEGLIKA